MERYLTHKVIESPQKDCAMNIGGWEMHVTATCNVLRKKTSVPLSALLYLIPISLYFEN